MATFNVKNEQIASKYEYADDNLKISGTFYKDKKTGELQKYDASVATADGSAFIGTVNAEFKDGDFVYSMPPTTKHNTELIWAALIEIEIEINKYGNED